MISTICFASFRSPPAGARINLPPDVIITSLCLFFVALAPKNLENLLGCSIGTSGPDLDVGLYGAGAECTTNWPSFKMRSLAFVRTGDQSMSSWVGGASSVMMRGLGFEGRAFGGADEEAEGGGGLDEEDCFGNDDRCCC